MLRSVNAYVRLVTLESRLEDQELIKAIAEFNQHSNSMSPPQDQATSQSAANRAVAAMGRFNKRAKVVLADLR